MSDECRVDLELAISSLKKELKNYKVIGKFDEKKHTLLAKAEMMKNLFPNDDNFNKFLEDLRSIVSEENCWIKWLNMSKQKQTKKKKPRNRAKCKVTDAHKYKKKECEMK